MKKITENQTTKLFKL